MSRDELRTSLESAAPDRFRQGIEALSRLDGPGALELWQPALRHPDPQLRREAWRLYRGVSRDLLRKEMVPKVARVALSPDALSDMARETGIEVAVWSSFGDETVAAAPEYLIERLESEGVAFSVLYDSIAAWQQALARGDLLAQTVAPEYQTRSAEDRLKVRIAVIDLARRTPPAPGYSDWMGDVENVVMSSDAFIAYLDVFSSDGSEDSINSHVEARYTRRGFRLAGFYTVSEFEEAASRFFPGQVFDSGARSNRSMQSDLKIAGAEGKFHSYEETLAEFTRLAGEHPDIARVVNLGQSYEGRQVFALKVSKNPELNDSTKPDVLITGCYHAREWISVEPPVYFANQLVNGYATDDSMKYLVDRLQIWIVPIVNPDGLAYSQGSANDRLDSVRLWRKNRRPVSIEGCRPGVGVDLNRNYDFQWRLQGDEPCPNISDDLGGSDDPENEIFRGVRAETEPELKALKSLIDDPERRFRAQLDYHNYSQLVLYPWGYQPFASPDDKTLSGLARRISDEIFKVDRKQYQPQQAIQLYATTGSSIDYAYGVNRVGAPFLIEMRPTSGNFNLPESQIEIINKENWAGARPVLEWAAGPPILESVKAYQQGSDGNFTKLVYSAHWSRSLNTDDRTRQLVVDTRFPGLESGRLQLHMQFSKPMDIATEPDARLGRDQRADELKLSVETGTEGWQKTVYLNDTWVGEAAIPPDDDLTNPWWLSVSATDAQSFELDGLPQTVAGYETGADRWSGYEDSNAGGSGGGIDRQHRLSPTLRGDRLMIFVGTPNGGERLSAGEPFTVAWTLPRDSGFVPVQQRVWLSTDGGINFAPITEDIWGIVDRFQVTLPETATTSARVRIAAREGVFGNTLFGDSATDFTIGANVTSAASINFVSSELLSQNWTDASSDLSSAATGPLRLIITLSLTNSGQVGVVNPFLRVAGVTRSNVLLTRDTGSSPTAGARQSIDAGGDNVLSPGETVQARLIVGLTGKKKFDLMVELYGVPATGSITPGSAIRVWKGKPRAK
jgi:hypothetical protein